MQHEHHQSNLDRGVLPGSWTHPVSSFKRCDSGPRWRTISSLAGSRWTGSRTCAVYYAPTYIKIVRLTVTTSLSLRTISARPFGDYQIMRFIKVPKPARRRTWDWTMVAQSFRGWLFFWGEARTCV